MPLQANATVAQRVGVPDAARAQGAVLQRSDRTRTEPATLVLRAVALLAQWSWHVPRRGPGRRAASSELVHPDRLYTQFIAPPPDEAVL